METGKNVEWTELGALLVQLRSEMEYKYIGGRFWSVQVGSEFRMRFQFALHSHPTYGPMFEFEVRASDVLDYRFAPDHALMEGTARFELLAQDELLTKRHFDTCDTDNWDSAEDPTTYRVLRNGQNYMIAKMFWGRAVV